MKRLIKYSMIIAVAAMSFASCQKEVSGGSDSQNTVKMMINASVVDTKTAVSENTAGGFDVNWTEGDQIKVFEFIDGELSQTADSDALTADSATATFSAELNPVTASSYSYSAIYPAASYKKMDSFYRTLISENQTFSATSFDKNADLLFAKPVEMDEQPEELNLQFRRIGSTARMVVKGVTPGETIKKIEFSTSEGKIVGYSKFDPETSEFLDTYSASKEVITLTPASLLTATGADVAWFRLYAIKLTNDFTVVVTTNAATYRKTIDLKTAGKSIEFVEGGLTKFNVAFSADNREANKETRYVLVTDDSSLQAGDRIVIANEAKSVVMTTVYNSTSSAGYNGAVTSTFSSESDVKVISSLGTNAAELTLSGSSSAWTITNTDGKVLGATAAKIICWDGAGAANTWTISIDSDNNATIASTNSAYGRFLYNVSSPRFSVYTSNVSTSMLLPQIYKLDDGTSPLDEPYIDVTKNAANNSITVVWVDDDHATNYTVLCSNGSSVNLEQTVAKGVETYTFTGLEYGKYTVTVVANPVSGYRSSSSNAEITLVDPKPSINVVETLNLKAAEIESSIDISYENISSDNLEVTIYTDSDCSIEAGEDFWLMAMLNSDCTKIEYYAEANEGEQRFAYIEVYGLGDNFEEVTKVITVTQEAPSAIPTYASLAALVAAGEPTESGTEVKVTLTNEVIQSIYVTKSGYRNGIILRSGDQDVEIYCYDVPSTWVAGGTVSATLTGNWILYSGKVWELMIDSWDEITYSAPAPGTDIVVLSEEFDNASTSDSTQAISNSTFNNFSGETAYAYKSQYGGLKLGSSKNSGYITSKSLDLSRPFTVKLNVLQYSTDGGIVQVTVGSVTKEITPTSTDTVYELDFDAATSSSTVRIGTSTKRAYIDNVVVTTH